MTPLDFSNPETLNALVEAFRIGYLQGVEDATPPYPRVDEDREVFSFRLKLEESIQFASIMKPTNQLEHTGMKLALDIHGVIDKNPSMFIALANSVHRASRENEVHILTGEAISKKLIEQLLSYNQDIVFWDYLISIQDELTKTNTPILRINEFDRPVFDDISWNSFKGLYCKDHAIDLAIDDTEVYREYFTTPFIRF